MLYFRRNLHVVRTVEIRSSRCFFALFIIAFAKLIRNKIKSTALYRSLFEIHGILSFCRNYFCMKDNLLLANKHFSIPLIILQPPNNRFIFSSAANSALLCEIVFLIDVLLLNQSEQPLVNFRRVIVLVHVIHYFADYRFIVFEVLVHHVGQNLPVAS